MTTTPELEAVAFAIFCAGGFHPSDVENGVAADMWAKETWPESNRKARRQARAALLAIREPSEAAVEAGYRAVQVGAVVHTPETAKAVARTIIRGAIDHILGGVE